MAETAIKSKAIKGLPAVVRHGSRRKSAVTLELENMISSFKPYELDTVYDTEDPEQEKQRVAMNQKLRSIAAGLGVTVNIRNIDGKISFQGKEKETDTETE